MKPRAAGLAVLAFAVAMPLLLVRTGGAAIHNGDEAIYAQMAREAVEDHHLAELTWQREPLFPRPPLAFWAIEAAHALGPERAVRWPLAAAAAAEVALVLLLGATLWSLGAGLTAAGTLLGFDLFIGYARYFESEPFLCAFVIGAFLCWELARTRPRFVYGWGACLAGALLTKQIIGALPLAALLVDAFGQDDPERSRPRVTGAGRALLVALALWLPWHVYAVARHGRAFVDSYFFGNVLARSQLGMLRTTRVTFYARELWRSEGVHGLVAALGVLFCARRAIASRHRDDLLVAGWALGPFVVFSLAASRYDHYLLLAYPALALGSARLLYVAPQIRPWLRALVAGAYVLTGGLVHLPRDLSVFDGDDELRALARAASAAARPPTPLYLYNTHGYSARYYGDLDVTTLLESPDDFRIANDLHRVGLPASVALAPDLAADLRARPRPFLLILPRARAALLDGAPLRPLAETRRYLLLLGDGVQ